MLEPRTLGEFLDCQTEVHGDRPALIHQPRYRTETWSYQDLRSRAVEFSRWLWERGVTRGDRVVLWAPNSPRWVAAYFGILRLGAAVVPLDVRSDRDYVQRVLGQTEPKVTLVSRRLAETWPNLPNAAVLEDVPLEAGGDSLPVAEVCPDDMAELMFTSGTTGDPKGVILTHGNILSNVRGVSQIIPSRPHYRLLSVLPLSHAFEQTVGLLLPLSGGASVFYPATRQSSELLRVFRQQRITMMLAVPQALQLFMDAIERQVSASGREAIWRAMLRLAERLPLSCRRLLFSRVRRRLGGKLSFLVSGGAALDPQLARRWELLGIPVLQGYGTTEASPVISGASPSQRKPGSVGCPISTVQLRISEDDEILVRGPGITPGYWRDARATGEAFSDGWYRTGDLGYLDHQGYLFIRGRVKDLIVLPNGQNVHAEDVERVLKQVPGVTDAVVLGMPSPEGERIHAAIVCAGDATDLAGLVRQANGKLASHQQIQGFSRWPDDDFPRTHTLKVKKREVLEVLRSNPEHPAPGASSRDTGTETPVFRLAVRTSGGSPGDIHGDATLGYDLGLDSLGRVELLSAIEEELGVYIDESQVEAATTLDQLEAMLSGQVLANTPEFKLWPLSSVARTVRGAIQAPLFLGMAALAPARVSGIEHLVQVKPPVLFAVNHTSHLDTPTVMRSLPWRWRRRLAVAAAADYFFADSWLGVAVGLTLNAFPFSRTSAIRPTLRHAAWLLDHGWSILIYPEGTRTTTGQLQTFKSGVGLLAVELEVPVVPVRTQGLFNVLPKGQTLPRPGRVDVRFGTPIHLAPTTTYEQATAIIEQAVRSLEPTEAHTSGELHS